ncbi:MAG TPA: Hsp20/alpha crystallin family protein [Pirellulales bacterium]|jgi:HSP20 family protein|nr:Hsp20/alpha crystallin family protein [Pirellulales bacterium]
MNMVPWRNKRKTGELSALGELRHEMDRLFDSFMRDPLGSLGETFGSRQWLPTVDVAETGDEIAVRAEIPGVDPKDLEITVAGSRVTIAGEKRESREQTDKDVHFSESRYGSFRRTIDLGSPVDPEQINAECEQGVLTVKLKKTKAAAAKRIAVKQS